jgi:hypothetical protein
MEAQAAEAEAGESEENAESAPSRLDEQLSPVVGRRFTRA